MDKFVEVDGLRLRYIEEGAGPAVLFLHGASLGSSSDVFSRNLQQFAKAGYRALALDLPGFGLSDIPEQQTVEQQRNAIPAFVTGLKIAPVALIAHSRSGIFAIELALADAITYSHIVVLGTGPLLPPQTEGQVARYEAIQSRVDKAMAENEPTPVDSRKLLETDTFNHDRISAEDVGIRHRFSVGRNFLAHRARQLGEGPAATAAVGDNPLWQRLIDLPVPLLMIYGRDDRAHAAARAGF